MRLATLGSVPHRIPAVVSRVIDDEAVLVHPAQGVVRVLNAAGARLWELVDGRRTIGALGQALAAEYAVAEARAAADALAFCEDLARRGVLTLDAPG